MKTEILNDKLLIHNLADLKNVMSDIEINLSKQLVGERWDDDVVNAYYDFDQPCTEFISTFYEYIGGSREEYQSDIIEIPAFLPVKTKLTHDVAPMGRKNVRARRTTKLTPKQIADIMTRRANGQAIQSLADDFSVSYSSIRVLTKPINVRLRLTPKEKADIVKRHNKGESQNSLRKAFNVSPTTISRVVKTIKTRSLLSQAQRAEIVRRCAKGETRQSVANRFSVTPRARRMVSAIATIGITDNTLM